MTLRKIFLNLFLSYLISHISYFSFAQTKTDTVSKPAIINFHSPKKATIMSAVIPGLGQAYNKKYWKIPVLYSGFGVMYYIVNYNQTRYTKYRNAYIESINSPADYPFMDKYTPDNLRTLSDAYHRDRDLSVIITSFVYILNIIDANVDAHLFKFDVSDNLSLSAQPSLYLSQNNTTFAGVSIKLKL